MMVPEGLDYNVVPSSLWQGFDGKDMSYVNGKDMSCVSLTGLHADCPIRDNDLK